MAAFSCHAVGSRGDRRQREFETRRSSLVTFLSLTPRRALKRIDVMNTSQRLTVFLLAILIASPCFAQSPAASPQVATSPVAAPSGQPNPAEMMKQMMELSKLTENHKLLGSLAGRWTYSVTMWMTPDPKAPQTHSAGSGVRKPMMGGRYFIAEYNGKMEAPDAEGKMKDMDFKGMAIEAYDNVKKKFVSSW